MLRRWARRKAADENTSVSKLVGGMIEQQMRTHDADYWEGMEKWKKIKPVKGIRRFAAPDSGTGT